MQHHCLFFYTLVSGAGTKLILGEAGQSFTACGVVLPKMGLGRDVAENLHGSFGSPLSTIFSKTCTSSPTYLRLIQYPTT